MNASVQAYLNPPAYREAKPTAPKLAKCATCGEAARRLPNFVMCSYPGCWVEGPRHDPDGAKWNAMQRAIHEWPLLREYVDAHALGRRRCLS